MDFCCDANYNRFEDRSTIAISCYVKLNIICFTINSCKCLSNRTCSSATKVDTSIHIRRFPKGANVINCISTHDPIVDLSVAIKQDNKDASRIYTCIFKTSIRNDLGLNINKEEWKNNEKVIPQFNKFDFRKFLSFKKNNR